jgi:hypothetical protein
LLPPFPEPYAADHEHRNRAGLHQRPKGDQSCRDPRSRWPAAVIGLPAAPRRRDVDAHYDT